MFIHFQLNGEKTFGKILYNHNNPRSIAMLKIYGTSVPENFTVIFSRTESGWKCDDEHFERYHPETTAEIINVLNRQLTSLN